jgi:hypothetical protein
LGEITNRPVKWQCSRTLGWGTFNLLWPMGSFPFRGAVLDSWNSWPLILAVDLPRLIFFGSRLATDPPKRKGEDHTNYGVVKLTPELSVRQCLHGAYSDYAIGKSFHCHNTRIVQELAGCMPRETHSCHGPLGMTEGVVGRPDRRWCDPRIPNHHSQERRSRRIGGRRAKITIAIPIVTSWPLGRSRACLRSPFSGPDM